MAYSRGMKIPLMPQLKWLKKFVAHPAAPQDIMSDLFQKAEHPSQVENRWVDGAPLAQARNAHYTNTSQELQAGLSGHYNFLEGDVTLEAGVRQIPLVDHFREPIMAHTPKEINGLTLGEWLDVGKSSGKGIKIDIKQSAAIPKIIQEVRQRELPDERLIFNADVAFGPGLEQNLKFRALDLATDFTTSAKEMKQIREAFPKATLGIGLYTGKQPKGTHYSADQLSEVIGFAQDMGGPITFPLRAEFVTPEVVATLKPHGTVSIWNDPKTFLPENKEIATKRFREMGVDGMIDLRGKGEPKKGPVYDSDILPPEFKRGDKGSR
jgi:menorin-like protein